MSRSIVIAAFTFASLFAGAEAAEKDAAALFARYKDRIFQVRLIDVESDKKSSLGTGFLVAADGLIATNYHVVSELVETPDKYRVEYEDEQGETGDLQLLDIDVVHDLALLKAEDVASDPLELPEAVPVQGDTIYSLGNPYDIGFTVIPGTYNGIDKDSYYRRIHFSGSINAGMSGGPVLNDSGGVVGVNVSSAGNQVSFLVPADALRSLIDEWRQRAGPVDDFDERVRSQLTENQRTLIDAMLAEEWPAQPLGEATALGEMPPYVKCWGESSDEDELYKHVSSTCSSNLQIYLGHRFSTGVISYQFFWIEAGQLGRQRFLNYYRRLFQGFGPDNVVGEDHVGNFVCDNRLVRDEAGHVDKAVLCVRAYRDLDGLYDVLYLSGSVDQTSKAFISHFTLAGVDRRSVEAFLERFRQVVHR